jgi:predicted RNase H-like HicB family nuclease
MANRSSTYAIVIEKAPKNFGAYVPDLPGCVATGKTVREVLASIAEAIDFHLDGMREDGLSVPEPTTIATYLATIGSKGGKTAADRMTPEQRRARAQAAGKAGGRGRSRDQSVVRKAATKRKATKARKTK